MSCRVIRGSVAYLLKKLGVYHYFSLWFYGPLKEDGWFRSFREGRSVDSNGNLIPWFTYPALEFICKRISSEMCVFEYGCGASTFWWAQRVKNVIACEHDSAWYQEMINIIPANVDLHHVPLEYGGDYCRMISSFSRQFDIVVIDGRDRVNCVKNTLNALKPKGIIILDNSDRDEYSEGYQFLLKNGFKKIEFVGMTPIVNCKSETGIFYRQENCLDI